ncbi:peroxiredoxin-like family protein [Rubrivirga sp.]|uniref:peroxiredoxin-like family protein n=1 Tax=Rubrivirga sp. TaxID=1885344 RepID=UPI003C746D91
MRSLLLLAVSFAVVGCSDPSTEGDLEAETTDVAPDLEADMTAEMAQASALAVGDRAPDFTLPDANGGTVRLSEMLVDGPVVLTFYRGAWCPYCDTQLRDYQQSLSDLESAGASLIAVSPQTPDSSLTSVEKNELAFPVLSDDGLEVSREYGLVFRVDEETRDRYRLGGVDLARYNGTDEWELPVPATYVIDQSGTVRAAFVEADYTQRASTRDVLEALRDLA